MILSIDIGLANCGWAIADKNSNVIACGVISTGKDKPESYKGATADNFRRMRQLSEALLSLRQTYPGIQALAVEDMSWPRSSSVVAKIGMAWGVLVSTCGDLPMASISPMEAKLFYAGNKKASKKDMIKSAGPLISKLKRAVQEHGADAIAVALCALKKPEVQAWLR